RALGYPSPKLLQQWLDEAIESRRRVRATTTCKAPVKRSPARVHAVLKRDGITLSEKIVRRLMREEGLKVVGRRRRRYNAYKGELSPAIPNLIERNFHADAPNAKWITDITEFQLPAGKVYLSPIIDCFDGMVAGWSI